MRNMLDDPTYKKLKKDPTTKMERRVAEALKKLETQGHIYTKQRRYLTPQFSKPPQMYGLPKIHKEGVPLRPIVSSIGSPTYNLAKEMARILTPLVGKTETTVKDAVEFVQLIKEKPTEDDTTMISFDVVTLFTKVPIDDALQAISSLLANDDTLEERTCITADEIRSLIEICLRTT